MDQPKQVSALTAVIVSVLWVAVPTLSTARIVTVTLRSPPAGAVPYATGPNVAGPDISDTDGDEPPTVHDAVIEATPDGSDALAEIVAVFGSPAHSPGKSSQILVGDALADNAGPAVSGGGGAAVVVVIAAVVGAAVVAGFVGGAGVDGVTVGGCVVVAAGGVGPGGGGAVVVGDGVSGAGAGSSGSDGSATDVVVVVSASVAEPRRTSGVGHPRTGSESKSSSGVTADTATQTRSLRFSGLRIATQAADSSTAMANTRSPPRRLPTMPSPGQEWIGTSTRWGIRITESAARIRASSSAFSSGAAPTGFADSVTASPSPTPIASPPTAAPTQIDRDRLITSPPGR